MRALDRGYPDGTTSRSRDLIPSARQLDDITTPHAHLRYRDNALWSIALIFHHWGYKTKTCNTKFDMFPRMPFTIIFGAP